VIEGQERSKSGLSSHSVKGISDLDFVLAEKIEEIFATQTASRATPGT